MTYRFTPITESEAREVLSWHYPDIATLYNPDPAEFEADVWELLAPEYHYHAVRDDETGSWAFVVLAKMHRCRTGTTACRHWTWDVD